MMLGALPILGPGCLHYPKPCIKKLNYQHGLFTLIHVHLVCKLTYAAVQVAPATRNPASRKGARGVLVRILHDSQNSMQLQFSVPFSVQFC